MLHSNLAKQYNNHQQTLSPSFTNNQTVTTDLESGLCILNVTRACICHSCRSYSPLSVARQREFVLMASSSSSSSCSCCACSYYSPSKNQCPHIRVIARLTRISILPLLTTRLTLVRGMPSPPHNTFNSQKRDTAPLLKTLTNPNRDPAFFN